MLTHFFFDGTNHKKDWFQDFPCRLQVDDILWHTIFPKKIQDILSDDEKDDVFIVTTVSFDKDDKGIYQDVGVFPH